MFMSAFWHGAHAGYYLCIMSVPPHLLVEDLYVKLFMKNAGAKVKYNIGDTHRSENGYNYKTKTSCVLYSNRFVLSFSFQFQRFLNLMFWFMRMQGFAYMSITFQLLTIDAAIRYWSSIYYCYHWLLAALYIIGLVLQMQRSKGDFHTEAVQHNFNAIDPPKSKKTE